MTDRSREDDAGQPDPTADTWSAWLPRLDPPTTPLPQASAPSESATPAVPPAPQADPPPSPVPPAPPAPPPTVPMKWHVAWPPQAPMPSPAGPQLHTAPPPNRLGLAILCTILCFTPFGIVALLKALSVKPTWARGRYDEARRTSASVKNWCLLAALAWPGSAIFLACTGMLLGH